MEVVSWNKPFTVAYKGIGAGPAGPALAGQLFVDSFQ